ncbi:Predicted membrane protein [Granulicatella balaenopterae]|uniref:Predicted membrane protein n=1 Tax=Granulicatella balaenopterae TaxID=137733 RepID=A0A1H9LTT5_9LACT|nr:cell wall-active antibiotics response protein LiaF [Granulicatella balaenopterae]SER14605.1 Predicted membrane protein [Granulicatella balaenopterae]
MQKVFLKSTLFIIIIACLFGFYELISEPLSFGLLFLGIFILILGSRMSYQQSMVRLLIMMVGVALIFMTGFSTSGFWVALILLIFIMIFYGKELLGASQKHLFHHQTINKKEYRAIKTIEPSHQLRRYKQNWLGSNLEGNDIYEWDDINIISLAGDTIIDLGNTILPNDENIIVIRKGFGSTRIIVPVGVDVFLHHSSISGTVIFNNEKINLQNESITVQSEGYHNGKKKVKIYTSTLFGEIEVIEL